MKTSFRQFPAANSDDILVRCDLSLRGRRYISSPQMVGRNAQLVAFSAARDLQSTLGGLLADRMLRCGVRAGAAGNTDVEVKL